MRHQVADEVEQEGAMAEIPAEQPNQQADTKWRGIQLRTLFMSWIGDNSLRRGSSRVRQTARKIHDINAIGGIWE